MEENVLTRLFYLVYPVYLFVNLCYQTTYFYEIKYFNFLSQSIELMILVLCIFIIITMQYNFNEIGWLMIFGIAILIMFFLSSRSWIIIFIIGITICKLDFKKILKITFYVTLFLLFITMFLNLLGIIGEYNLVRDNGIMRYSLGFTHPNVLGAISFILIIEFFCFISLNPKLIEYFLGISFSIIFFNITGSRTALLVSLCFIIGISLNNYFNFQTIKKILKFMLLLPALLFLLSVHLTINYDASNSVYTFWNQMLSNRLLYANLFYKQYGFNFWGHQDLIFVSTKEAKSIFGLNTMVVDNAYILYLLENGLIPIILMIILLSFLLYYFYKVREYQLFLGLSFFIIYGMFERYLFNYTYNFFLLLTFLPILKKHYSINKWGRDIV